MTIGPRAGNRDGPADGNDLPQDQHQHGQAAPSSTNGHQPDGQPHRSPEAAECPVPMPAESSEQPGTYQGPVRGPCDLFWRLAQNKRAQEGADRLLRSFSRNVIFPVILLLILLAVIVILLESMPHASLALKIIPSAVATVGIASAAFMTKRKPRKSRSKTHHQKAVNDDLNEDQADFQGDND